MPLRPQRVYVLLRPIAEPNLRSLRRRNNSRGEVYGAAKNIVPLDLHRTNMNSRTNTQMRVAGRRSKRNRKIKSLFDSSECRHETITDSFNLASVMRRQERSALLEVGEANRIHALASHLELELS